MLKSYMRSSCTGHPHLLSGAETESSMSIKKKKKSPCQPSGVSHLPPTRPEALPL